MFDIQLYLKLFIIYSFLGWIIEVIYTKFCFKKLSNRGFLIGPYCPIYGTSALIIILLFSDFNSNPFLLFLIIMTVATLIEYFTSYIMEKLFNARWWDYSNQKFNINGRVCLENMILFGVLGLIVVYFINPFLNDALMKYDLIYSTFLLSIILIFFSIDFIVSFNIIRRLKISADIIKRDYTDDIAERVKKQIYRKAKMTKLLTLRLINAFPQYKIIIKKKNK